MVLNSQNTPNPSQKKERVLEKLLHCIWSEQLFRRTLQLDGKPLMISSPGWWNLEAGPDFRNAEVYLDGKRLCGDIEIHLTTADWYQHHHHEDARYNGVILHVVLYKSQEPCRKFNGESIPQLEIKDYLLEELRLLKEKIPVEQFPFGPEVNVRLCRRFLEEQGPESTPRILDSAGDLRMKRKKQRLLSRMKTEGFEQTLYEALMEGMGYKQSRFAFRELALRVPLRELRNYDLPNRHGIDSMAAVLLGTANLLEDMAENRLLAVDRETASYLDALFRLWKRFRPEFHSRALTGFCWYPGSSRPANFPVRRITAVAAFFHYQGNNLLTRLIQPIPASPDSRVIRTLLRNWLELFSRPLHIYWSYHYQFDGNKFAAPRRLIGRERGRILIVNAIIPSLLAYAELTGQTELERILFEVYKHHPRLGANCITRLMEHRLFGSHLGAKGLICSARRQQALHHFFFDFCDNRETLCSRCELKNPGTGKTIYQEEEPLSS